MTRRERGEGGGGAGEEIERKRAVGGRMGKVEMGGEREDKGRRGGGRRIKG